MPTIKSTILCALIGVTFNSWAAPQVNYIISSRQADRFTGPFSVQRGSYELGSQSGLFPSELSPTVGITADSQSSVVNGTCDKNCTDEKEVGVSVRYEFSILNNQNSPPDGTTSLDIPIKIFIDYRMSATAHDYTGSTVNPPQFKKNSVRLEAYDYRNGFYDQFVYSFNMNSADSPGGELISSTRIGSGLFRYDLINGAKGQIFMSADAYSSGGAFAHTDIRSYVEIDKDWLIAHPGFFIAPGPGVLASFTTAVPETSTFSYGLLGLIALAGLAREKRSSKPV